MMMLARVPVLRLARTKRAWLPVLGYVVLALVMAIVAGRSGGASGTDHVMRGTFRWLVIPLVAYAIVSASLGGAGMKRAVRGVVMLGAAPRRAALETTLVASLASGLVCGVLASIGTLLSHNAADAPLASDLLASTWVSALGGLAYGAYFCGGSAIREGGARGLFLAFDWIVGSGTGGLALLTPRAHLATLMGGPLSGDISARTSFIVLAALTVIFTATSVYFVKRA